MKNLYLFAIFFACSLMVYGQTFTIGHSYTGMTPDIFGQGFTPSIQGNGSGTVGSDQLVGLYQFSFMLDANETPDILYIYEEIPATMETLMDGTGGKVVGQSTSKTEESYGYTHYEFEGLALDKDKVYYALFREAVTCEAGMGDYEGGYLYELHNNNLKTSEYVDTKFTASFAPPAPTNIPVEQIASFSVFPSQTNGIITIRSEGPADIDVYALTGTKVKTFKVNQGQNQKSIADLPSGIYIFKNQINIICKVIKKGR